MEKALIYFFSFLFLGIVSILLLSKNKKERYTTLGKIGEKIQDIVRRNNDDYGSYSDEDSLGKYSDNTHYDKQSIRKSRGQIQHDYHE